MNAEISIKELSKTADPPGTAKQHKEIFLELAKTMGAPIKESAGEMKSAFEVSGKQKFSPFQKTEGIDVKPAEFIEAINKPVIQKSRLLWLKETEEAVPA